MDKTRERNKFEFERFTNPTIIAVYFTLAYERLYLFPTKFTIFRYLFIDFGVNVSWRVHIQ